MSAVVMHFAPAAMEKTLAAAYLSLKESTFEALVRQGDLPPGRKLSDRRVGWLRQELDEWLYSRPPSDCLPPPKTGHGNRNRGPKTKPSATPNAQTAA